MSDLVINCEQRSDEWFELRCGNVTASSFSDVMAGGKGLTRASYMRRIVAERITGKPTETYRSPSMIRGEELEVFAKIAYIAKTGRNIRDVGFVKHPTLMAGASPDGLVEEDGLAEIKSVIATTQIDTIIAGVMPTTHKAQVQGQLWITGRKWCDFISYCEEMPEEGQLFIERVYRDEMYICQIEREVSKFLSEVDQKVAEIKEKMQYMH